MANALSKKANPADTSSLSDNQSIILELRQKGWKLKDIARSLDLSMSYVGHVCSELNKNGMLQLVNDKRVKKAHRVIDNLMDARPWGSVKTISDKAALAASQAVIDRHEPKKEASAAPETVNVFNIVNIKSELAGYQETPCVEINDNENINE